MSTGKISENEEIYDRMLSIFADRGINQAKFIEMTGYSSGQASAIFNRKANLNRRLVTTICRAFSISEDWLRHETGPIEAVGEKSGYAVVGVVRKLTPDMEKLLELLEGVPLDPDVIAELGRNADAREMMENYIRLPKSRQKRRLGDVIADREELEKEKD